MSRTEVGAAKSRCVSKKPTDRKNGSRGARAGSRSPIGAIVAGVVRVDVDHLVVADHRRVHRDVLLADQRRAVARRAQRVHEVLAVVVQRQPRWARPSIPLPAPPWPVSRQARLPEQVGIAQKASRNSTPWSASSWMFGVGTA